MSDMSDMFAPGYMILSSDFYPGDNGECIAGIAYDNTCKQVDVLPSKNQALCVS